MSKPKKTEAIMVKLTPTDFEDVKLCAEVDSRNVTDWARVAILSKANKQAKVIRQCREAK